MRRRQCCQDCAPFDQVKLGCTGVCFIEQPCAAGQCLQAASLHSSSKLIWLHLAGGLAVCNFVACTGAVLDPETAIFLVKDSLPVTSCSTPSRAENVACQPALAPHVHSTCVEFQ